MTIPEFLGLLHKASKHYQFYLETVSFPAALPTVKYLRCRFPSEPTQVRDVIDGVCSYIAGTEFVVGGAEEATYILSMSHSDLSKIVCAASCIDILNNDGSYLVKYSRNLRADLLKAVGLAD